MLFAQEMIHVQTPIENHAAACRTEAESHPLALSLKPSEATSSSNGWQIVKVVGCDYEYFDNGIWGDRTETIITLENGLVWRLNGFKHGLHIGSSVQHKTFTPDSDAYKQGWKHSLIVRESYLPRGNNFYGAKHITYRCTDENNYGTWFEVHWSHKTNLEIETNPDAWFSGLDLQFHNDEI